MGWIGFNFVSEESALPTDPMAWFTVTAVFALVGFVLLMLCFMGSKENITFSHVSIYPLVKFRSSRPKTA